MEDLLEDNAENILQLMILLSVMQSIPYAEARAKLEETRGMVEIVS